MLGTLSWARHAVFRGYWGKEELRPKGQNSVMRASKNNGQKYKGGKLNGNITMDPRWGALGCVEVGKRARTKNYQMNKTEGNQELNVQLSLA